MAAEDTVADLEGKLAQAIAVCDGAACAAFLADDFTAIHARPDNALIVVLQREWLRAVEGCQPRCYSVNDVTVSLHGDLAVATVLWTDGEGTTAQQFFATDIWRSSSGQWRLLERHIGRPDITT